MKKTTIVVFVGLLIKSTLCFSWGGKGHKIVAQIAKIYLDKNIQDSVQKYLGDMSFEDAAVWMDVIKSDHTYDHLKPLHYINIEKDKTYVKHDGNIVSELELVIAQLKNKSKRSSDDVKTAIKVLFHLVGDLHQPLHVGYGEDKGGNTVQVQFNGKGTNLHHVWDSDIIESKNIVAADCIRIIQRYSPKEVKDIQTIDVVTWMNDSRILLPAVYGFKTNVLDEEYINKNALVIEKQLANAGLRLVSVLNATFK